MEMRLGRLRPVVVVRRAAAAGRPEAATEVPEELTLAPVWREEVAAAVRQAVAADVVAFLVVELMREVDREVAQGLRAAPDPPERTRWGRRAIRLLVVRVAQAATAILAVVVAVAAAGKLPVPPAAAAALVAMVASADSARRWAAAAGADRSVFMLITVRLQF